MNTAGNLRNILLLFVPGTLWGVSFLFVEIVLETIPPFTLTLSRSLIAAIPLLLALYFLGGRLPQLSRAWYPYLVLGIFNNAVPYALITWGQVHIDSGLATILISTMPLFTILLAHFFIADEHFTQGKLLGIGLGLVGILVLIGPDALQGLGLNIWGQLAVIGGGFSYAVAAIYSRLLLRNSQSNDKSKWIPLLELMSGQLITGTLFILPLSLIVEAPWRLQPSVLSITALITLGLLGTSVATLVYVYLIDAVGATFASTVVYLIPLNGVFWGAYILKEIVTWQAIIALILILSGIAIVNGFIGPRPRKPKESALPTSAR